MTFTCLHTPFKNFSSNYYIFKNIKNHVLVFRNNTCHFEGLQKAGTESVCFLGLEIRPRSSEVQPCRLEGTLMCGRGPEKFIHVKADLGEAPS